MTTGSLALFRRFCPPAAAGAGVRIAAHPLVPSRRLVPVKSGGALRTTTVTASVLLGTGLIVFTPDATLENFGHAVEAARRTGRVVGTLFTCMNEYRIPTLVSSWDKG